MSSELLRLLIDNANRLSVVDFLLLIVAAISVATSAAVVIHWIYKQALEKQGQVINSQDKLIALKDKTIAEYEQSIKRLADEKSRTGTRLSDTSKHIDQLKEQLATHDRDRHEREAELLLFAALQTIGVLVAKGLFYRLEFCSSMRFLVSAYAAVRRQHHDESGPSVDKLLAEIEAAEIFFLNQARILDRLDRLPVRGIANQAPEALLSYSTTEGRTENSRQRRLEEFVVTNTLPVLQKYEPKFASRVENSYKARKS